MRLPQTIPGLFDLVPKKRNPGERELKSEPEPAASLEKDGE
jgi:hypothetical protein